MWRAVGRTKRRAKREAIGEIGEINSEQRKRSCNVGSEKEDSLKRIRKNKHSRATRYGKTGESREEESRGDRQFEDVKIEA